MNTKDLTSERNRLRIQKTHATVLLKAVIANDNALELSNIEQTIEKNEKRILEYRKQLAFIRGYLSSIKAINVNNNNKVINMMTLSQRLTADTTIKSHQE